MGTANLLTITTKGEAQCKEEVLPHSTPAGQDRTKQTHQQIQDRNEQLQKREIGKQITATRHRKPELMEDGEGANKREKHKRNSTN